MKVGMFLPQVGEYATKENILYIAKDTSKGPAKCQSETGSVRDGVRLWADSDKVCKPNTLSCGDKDCSGEWNVG